eukprot:137886-Chlamydomonas_euryale.AAC.1
MSRLHDVFNVCLLKPYKRARNYQTVTINPRRLSSSRTVTSQHSSLRPFVVTARLLTTSSTVFAPPARVVWKGYPLSEASSEPESNLCLLSEFAAYWRTQPSVPPGVQRALRARDRYLAEHPDEAD